MRILLAVDSEVTTDMLMNAVASRPWPHGTCARVISVVEDETVPEEGMGFRSWMLGSVAKSVVREAHCSVKVVRSATGE